MLAGPISVRQNGTPLLSQQVSCTDCMECFALGPENISQAVLQILHFAKLSLAVRPHEFNIAAGYQSRPRLFFFCWKSKCYWSFSHTVHELFRRTLRTLCHCVLEPDSKRNIFSLRSTNRLPFFHFPLFFPPLNIWEETIQHAVITHWNKNNEKTAMQWLLSLKSTHLQNLVQIRFKHNMPIINWRAFILHTVVILLLCAAKRC